MSIPELSLMAARGIKDISKISTKRPEPTCCVENTPCIRIYEVFFNTIGQKCEYRLLGMNGNLCCF
jgi:hypothetical protein